MALTLKKLAQNQLTAVAAAQYTVPGSTRASVTTILVMNDDTVERTFTLHFVPSGGGVAATNKFFDAVPVGPGQTLQISFDRPLVLESGDFISAFASVAGQVNMHISGAEIT